MAERVQKSHTTTLFVASVGNTRFEPTDGAATFASLHPHNEDQIGLRIAGIGRRFAGSTTAHSRRQGGAV